MWQALVKTTPDMAGSYNYTFDSKEVRQEFVERPDVWWYYFPEDADDFGDSVLQSRFQLASRGWQQGGAWDRQEPEPQPSDDSEDRW